MGHLGLLFLFIALLTCLRVHGQPSCGRDAFACGSGRCIALRFRCDGADQCGDGSDETSCHNCTGFSCGPSGQCLTRTQLCDGRVDCADGRDESRQVCGSVRPDPHTCKASQFRCGDGQCVPHTWRCDNSTDCTDGSDEVNCDQNECAVNNGGCSHHCKDLRMGFICECPRDMVLVGEYQCEEVDPCLDADVCDQVCVPVNGRITCSCHQDYKMSPTTGECKAKGEKAAVVVTSSEGLRWASLGGGEYREPARQAAGPGLVVGLASNGTLYWVPRCCGSIYSVSTHENNRDSRLVLRVQGPVSGLAVDWIHHLLYWTSMGSGAVHVALLDGSAQRALVAGLEKPSAVAVDPLHRLLFWAQSGSSPKIERAGLDGRDRKALVTHLMRHPVALSLDLPRQLLYWMDQGTKTISRVNFEGRHRKTVVESNGYLDQPFGLAVFEGFVYWSEAVTRSICRANKHNGRNFSVLLSNANSPGGVFIMHSALQPSGPSACSHAGRVCQHECVVDLLSDGPEFRCVPPETGLKRPQESPSISRTVPASTLSDPSLAGILSLILFLSILLVGTALWWWQGQFRVPRPLDQSFSLKESQDPLLLGEPPIEPNTCLRKETLLKMDLGAE
eukprot:XP_011613323.1 PREDICTED: very low-density lipoprotein receptor-like [Takifugu rubripes]